MSPCAAQLSGRDPQGRFILSVLAKRTYDIGSGGRCTPTPEPSPLIDDPVYSKSTGELLHDTDLFPFKLATDIIVKGHAYLPRVQPFGPSGMVSLRVGRLERQVAVFGDRRCALSGGKLLFSPQQPVEKIPLGFSHAYGGRDSAAEKKHGNPALQWAQPLGANPADLSDASPYLYPRNFAGRGFLIEPTAEAVEQVRLPNLEDPRHLLTPETLAVGSVDRWAAMPMPAAFGWVHLMWFPRIVLAGFPYPSPSFKGEAAETTGGWLPPGLLGESVHELAGHRFASGAPVQMQAPFLRGDEHVLIEGVRPGGEPLAFRLPGERPKLQTDARNGRFKRTKPLIHTLLIEPDALRVTIVWRGSAPALRPYLDNELATMPYHVKW